MPEVHAQLRLLGDARKHGRAQQKAAGEVLLTMPHWRVGHDAGSATLIPDYSAQVKKQGVLVCFHASVGFGRRRSMRTGMGSTTRMISQH